MNINRFLTAAVLGIGVIIMAAAPSKAATEGRIDSITSSGDQLSILFSATSLDPAQGIDPTSVQVTVEGQPVQTDVRGFEAASGPGRTAVLALDVSGSMQGAGLAGAKRAADSFLGSVPDDVAVGLVTFGDTARLVVEPTTDHGRVAETVAGLKTGGDTALYDGVVKAVAAAGDDGARSVVVLSDGKDEGSSATLAQARAAVGDSGVGVDAVALGDGGKQAAAALNELAAAGSGQVFGAREAADLERAFAASAASLESQLQISAQVPAGTDESVAVTVSAKSGETTISDSAVALVEPRVVAAPISGPEAASISAVQTLLSNPLVAALAIALVFIALAVLLTFAFLSETDEGRVTRRIGGYLGGRGESARRDAAQPAGRQLATSTVDLVDRLSSKRGIDQKVGLKLEAAGLSIKPAEWLLLQAGVVVLAAGLIGLVTGFKVLPVLAAAAIGLVVPYLYLGMKAGRRRTEFNEQLPDTLTLIAGSLSAGHSILQAFDTVVRETDGVVHDELSRAIIETRLGVEVQEALEGVAARMDSEDFGWVVQAIKINREIGGDLAEVLRNVAGMLRERERLRRQVQVLSAEGRLSAVVIVGLLPALVFYMLLVRPEYIMPLFTTPMGLVMSAMALLLLVAGGVWISKIVRIEV